MVNTIQILFGLTEFWNFSVSDACVCQRMDNEHLQPKESIYES